MSPAFIALVRKERLFLIPFALGALVSQALLLIVSFETLFVFVSDEALHALALLHLPLALLAGGWLGLREEVTRTEEFLRQRPLPPTLPVLARGLAGSLILLLTPLIAGAVALLYDLSLAGGGVGVRADTWASLLAVACAGVAAFSASFLVGCAPVSWLARACALFFLLMAQLILQSWLSSLLSAPIWALVVLGWSAALLATTCLFARRPRDLERPPGAELTGAPLAVMALAAVAFGALATAGWQKLASGELAEARPWIGWTTDGRLVRCKWVGKHGSLDVVDEHGRATGEELDDDQPRVSPARHTLHAIRAFPASRARSYRLGYSDRTERRVVVDSSRVRWIESDPDTKERLSVDLAATEDLGDPHQLLLFELQDGVYFLAAKGTSLWRIQRDDVPRLERVELPGGARPIDTTHFFGTGDDWKLGRALDTTDGAFFHRDGQWVRPDASLYRQPRLENEIVEHDPFTPLQRITGPGGVLLDVAHPLDTAGKKLLAGWMGLSSVLRPLPLALVSATLDYERVADEQLDEFLVLFDPVLGGGYAWLLVPNVLLHVWLAWGVSRELARRGLEPARRRRWALAYLAAGIWIAAWCAALETRRAWKKSRSGPAPVPLIHEARGAA